MDEMKSAWEIAQERVNRLGRLSGDEQEQQERERYRQIGQALAQRWLDGSRQTDVNAELDRHDEKGRKIITQGLIRRLTEAIDLANDRSIDDKKRVVQAIGIVEPRLQPKADELAELLQQYQEAEQKLRGELEVDYRETLHRLRISGTAVGAINLEASGEWQLARSELIAAFAPRLSALKQALVS